MRSLVRSSRLLQLAALILITNNKSFFELTIYNICAIRYKIHKHPPSNNLDNERYTLQQTRHLTYRDIQLYKKNINKFQGNVYIREWIIPT